MSRIDKLIAKLCPNGVEFKALGEVAAYSDTRIPATAVHSESFVGVDNLLPNQKGRTSSAYVPVSGNLTKYRQNDILIGNIRPYLKKIWLATNAGGCSGDVLAVRISDENHPRLTPEFLYRLLSADHFFNFNMRHAKGAKMPRGSKGAILKYRFPVPPLEIQREIVKVLDAFTELEAELEARRKQYKHYRDSLLTFDDASTKSERVRRVALSEICLQTSSIKWAETPNAEFAYIDLSSVDRMTHTIGETLPVDAGNAPSRAQQVVRTDDVLFGTTRPTLQRYCSVPAKFDGQICSTGFCVLRADDEHALPRWLFHQVSASGFQRYVEENERGAGYPAIADSVVMKFRVPVPPLEEQARIVAILDKFDALTNDLSEGLPAEIAARRKQYEHYRDHLLTFQEAA